MNNDYPKLPPSEKERAERREKKRRPKIHISGRGLLDLARIVQEKAKGERSPSTKSRKKQK